jgi:hypothetical protein
MSVMRRNVLQAKDNLRQASNILADTNDCAPDLQELKNAAKLASQTAETLNRLVGMQMVVQSMGK